MNLKNKRAIVLFFCTVTALMFCGCQTMDEAMNPTTVFSDYGVRNYDLALMRFSMIDSVTEKYPSASPYTYVLDKLVYIDLKSDSLLKVFHAQLSKKRSFVLGGFSESCLKQ